MLEEARGTAGSILGLIYIYIYTHVFICIMYIHIHIYLYYLALFIYIYTHVLYVCVFIYTHTISSISDRFRRYKRPNVFFLGILSRVENPTGEPQ